MQVTLTFGLKSTAAEVRQGLGRSWDGLHDLLAAVTTDIAGLASTQVSPPNKWPVIGTYSEKAFLTNEVPAVLQRSVKVYVGTGSNAMDLLTHLNDLVSEHNSDDVNDMEAIHVVPCDAIVDASLVLLRHDESAVLPGLLMCNKSVLVVCEEGTNSLQVRPYPGRQGADLRTANLWQLLKKHSRLGAVAPRRLRETSQRRNSLPITESLRRTRLVVDVYDAAGYYSHSSLRNAGSAAPSFTVHFGDTETSCGPCGATPSWVHAPHAVSPQYVASPFANTACAYGSGPETNCPDRASHSRNVDVVRGGTDPHRNMYGSSCSASGVSIKARAGGQGGAAAPLVAYSHAQRAVPVRAARSVVFALHNIAGPGTPTDLVRVLQNTYGIAAKLVETSEVGKALDAASPPAGIVVMLMPEKFDRLPVPDLPRRAGVKSLVVEITIFRLSSSVFRQLLVDKHSRNIMTQDAGNQSLIAEIASACVDNAGL
jgi:hypothetical protein